MANELASQSFRIQSATMTSYEKLSDEIGWPCSSAAYSKMSGNESSIEVKPALLIASSLQGSVSLEPQPIEQEA
jgi:hypothetical protein